LHIGPVRSGLTPCFLPYYRKRRPVEAVDLERAATILANLELIFDHAPDPLYRRLRKGFKVWIRGTEEAQEWSERLHSFVRATEAMIKPTIIVRRRRVRGKNTLRTFGRPISATFKSRGQTFTGHSKSSERLLGQLYETRSSVEHTKDINPTVRQARGIPKEEAFEFRALQCEILASTVYSRILSSPQLLERFSTERKVEGFWSRNHTRRQVLWGDPIAIDTATRDQFFSRHMDDFY
jgi:hypothetical protein